MAIFISLYDLIPDSSWFHSEDRASQDIAARPYEPVCSRTSDRHNFLRVQSLTYSNRLFPSPGLRFVPVLDLGRLFVFCLGRIDYPFDLLFLEAAPPHRAASHDLVSAFSSMLIQKVIG
jgi:hypothetical protein